MTSYGLLCSYVALEKIPDWTGFNYLIHKKRESEDIQKVIYLPGIHASPAKLDTVLEMLLQSKAKAEHLGLVETDVIVDQAIYAKAVEILENPAHKDLKDFTVLQMGGFHIAMTFIGVIGKRFKDAALEDLLVESTLFGMKSLFIRTFLWYPYCKNALYTVQTLTYSVLLMIYLIGKNFVGEIFVT